ncbi:hypothetical protein G6F46_003081 [Rhizopus delemar]|nr:hypothetical protein G6F54_002462 [Rhizopus delemar]KAG1509509.1 hypothetical protein G6F53_007394 [Rhizopus delemar]KAG1551909.1 hypothetical protein G6F49_008846 [Rhizopus delemar]KAG1593522.1 hypothetical protein G6F47_009092 [Rhizopus delemar]KAG1619553.1 hypothetical protein G6F46_003081 [Rhizopus delemar]
MSSPLLNLRLPDPIVIPALPLTGLYVCMLGTDYILLRYQRTVSKTQLRVAITTAHALVPLVVASPSSPANVAFATVPWFVASYSAGLPLDTFSVKEWTRAIFETVIDRSPVEGNVYVQGLVKTGRGILKLLILVYGVQPLLPSRPDLMLRYPWFSKTSLIHTFLFGLDAYLIMGFLDMAAGVVQVMTGLKMEDMFDSPFLATSRRWNKHIRNLLHAQIFSKAKEKKEKKKPKGFLSTVQGRGLLSFTASAIFHELIVWSVCRRVTLENLCFFSLHGLVCAIEVKYFKKQPQSRLGQCVGIMGQLSFMVMTGRLFLGPYLRHRFMEPLPLTRF